MTGSARRPAILRVGTLIEAVDQAERNDARAPKAIFPLLFAFAETYKRA